MKICTLDFETSIGKTVHGATFRDPENDIYTQILATHPDHVQVVHDEDGFKRRIYGNLPQCDYIVGHNLGFDLSYVFDDVQIKEYFTKGGKVWDTQVAEYLLTGMQHKFASLAELQEKYLGQKEKPTRISYLYSKGVGADKIVKAKRRCPRLFKLYEEYCRTDGATPLLIFKKQYVRAKASNMLEIIDLYNDYCISLVNMTVSGIKLDADACQKKYHELYDKYLEHLIAAQEILKSVWNDPRLPEFNINSNDHKSAVLFGGNIEIHETVQDGNYKNGNPRYRKVPVAIHVKGFGISQYLSEPTKKDGVYRTDDATMKKIAEKTTSNAVKEYCSHQERAMNFKKFANTYCKAFLERSVNGYLYPNFNNTATETGRLSSSSPNLQNVAKRSDLGKELHKLFIAPDGWKCVQIDFSQLEIFVLAWLSGDVLLTEHLLAGTDLHIVRLGYYNDMSYDELFKLCKIDKDPYWDRQRSAAKTVSYQMAYGAQPPKVAESTGLDLEIVEKIFAKEAETYPDAAALSKQVMSSIANTATLSRAYDIPSSQKKGKHGARFLGSAELLPIFDKSGEVVYNKQELRRVGYWTSPTGKKYHFQDSGRLSKNGKQIMRNFSFTQPKNYPMQGSAADIQAATTCEILKALLTRRDKIRMINEVHDSKWFYVREEFLDDVLPYLKNIIEDVPKIFLKRFGIAVPFKFPVDIEVGDNFGEMEKYDFNTTTKGAVR
jgi:DNA polymerase I-like protein with 3'-5' exonuclease and polymerase domains